jgi:hypothetical protein
LIFLLKPAVSRSRVAKTEIASVIISSHDSEVPVWMGWVVQRHGCSAFNLLGH